MRKASQSKRILYRTIGFQDRCSTLLLHLPKSSAIFTNDRGKSVSYVKRKKIANCFALSMGGAPPEVIQHLQMKHLLFFIKLRTHIVTGAGLEPATSSL